MKIRSAFAIILLIGLSMGCNQEVKQEKNNKFSGLWSLHLMEKLNPETGEWNEWRDGMQGYLLYDNTNNMSIHLTTKGYEEFDLIFPNFVDTIPQEALKHLTNSYVYFGKYTVNEEKKTIEHARISHSNPKSWNEVVQRSYHFSGDTLTLQPVENKLSNHRVVWVKEEGS